MTLSAEIAYVRPTVATVLPTYRCNAECENCCFFSNPRVMGRLGIEKIFSYIDDISKIGTVQVFVISGGECFLLGDDLVRIVGYANSKSLVTRVVTNGFWAKDIKKGQKILGKLVDSGLDEINISTGEQHVRFVSLEAVSNAVKLADHYGLRGVVVVELHKKTGICADDVASRDELKPIFENNDRIRVIESPWMPMDCSEGSGQDSDMLLNKKNVDCRGGCKDILETVVLTPTGSIGHCCGLAREEIDELNSTVGDAEGEFGKVIRKASADLMKMWLYVDGPEKIISWAAGVDPSIDWENKYSHRCHACNAVFNDEKIRNVVSNGLAYKKDEIVFRYAVSLKKDQILNKYLLQHYVGETQK